MVEKSEADLLDEFHDYVANLPNRQVLGVVEKEENRDGMFHQKCAVLARRVAYERNIL